VAIPSHDQIAGVFLGLAIGDALGAPVEGKSPEEIRSMLAQGVTGMDGGGADNMTPGTITDDTTLALALARGMTDAGSFDHQVVLANYLHWFKTDGRGIGRNTRKVMTAIGNGVPYEQATRDFYEETKSWRRVSNGGLMRCAPLAIRYWNNPNKLREVSIHDAALTHYHPLSGEVCARFNAMIAALFCGKDPEPWLMSEHEDITAALAMNKEEVEAYAASEGSYLMTPFAVAVCALREFDALDEALLWAVNLGGDTDTNAAVAGALLGARFGATNIPVAWLEVLEARDEIEALSVRLFEQSNDTPAVAPDSEIDRPTPKQ
jgi:ADP-ribosyl-[dinitrogen reductase] hydrolase